ncbi:MAG: M20/M25/M40 family metallo-hydrolase [Candidatus Flexifilum sp.]
MKRRLLVPLLALASLGLAAIACNLSSESAPPTIVPRATATPPPTIGYATLAPEELPLVATSIPQQQTGTALVNIINQVQGDRLYEHVTNLQNMYTRHINSSRTDPARGVGAAAAYVQRQFEAIRAQSAGRLTVLPPHEFSMTMADIQTTQSNIIAVIGGSETGAGIVLIGAHYDSRTVAFDDAVSFAPGANDNASGVAALIEIARIMSQYPQRATVMFVAFGAEEFQRRGSLALIEEYLRPNNIEISYMLNMDIIGSSTGPNGSLIDNRMRVYSAGEDDMAPSRQLARALNLIAARYIPGMTLEVIPAGDREGRYSDHLSFSEIGVPAVRFIEALENPNRNHNDQDVVGNLRVSYFVRATQTVLASAMALAGGPRPPENISLRDDGSGQRTLVWQPSPDARSYIVALRRPGSLLYDNFFEVTANTVTWDGFTRSRFAGVAIAAQDASGLMGPFSFEYQILN